MNSFNFQIVPVANLAAIVTPFPDHICYFTEDTENYYIWENNALKEIFVDASSITWNNITNKPTTITGFGITDAVKVNNGTLNYLAKFTPDGTTIGNSQIVDDGQRVSIGTPNTGKLTVETSTILVGIRADVTLNSGTALAGQSLGSGFGSNTGVRGYAANSTTQNIGVEGVANVASAENIGLSARASNATNNYAIQLFDTTSNVVGRYLRNMTTDGKANWANINITEVTNGLSSTLLGAPNGIATLDNNSKLVISQMPISVMDYKGTYDIVTNTPNLQDGVGNQGDVYVCTTAGTRTFGAGNTLTVSVGDWLIYNGTKWEKTLGNNVGSGTVTSVGLSLGTTGTDVNISNSPITSSGNINLNIPTASATARGLLSTGDWTTFNSKVGGSGTLNYLPKFTASGTIGMSRLYEENNSFSIGTGASSFVNTAFFVQGISGQSTGGAFYNHTSGTSVGYGLIGVSTQLLGTNIGVEGRSLSIGSSVNIGLVGKAGSGSSNYAIQLSDGTQGLGKFLKCVNGTEGYANWANITVADVSGAVAGAPNGTTDYVARWTPNNSTIGIGKIRDDGNTIGINAAPQPNITANIISNSATGLYVSNSIIQNGISVKTGMTINVSGALSDNRGIDLSVSGGTTDNTGVLASATAASGATAWGGQFTAQGAGTKYSVKLTDGTNASNKFLKCITNNGDANWAYIPSEAQIMCSDLTTGITSSAVAKAFWHAPCDGQFTDIVFYRRYPSGTMTVEVRKVIGGTLVASITFGNGTNGASAVTTSSFSRYEAFDIFVTATSDSNSKGLLATFNYNRV